MHRIGNKKLSQLNEKEAVQAVEFGLKPIAFVTRQFDTELPFISFEMPYLHLCPEMKTIANKWMSAGYVYFQPHLGYQAQRLQELVLERNNLYLELNIGDAYVPALMDETYHREMGTLLGYSSEEIENFLTK